jgi:pyruvate dehydrogenase E2 component (dihydrolipoyllysine-residue acetyltransferase)
MATEITMPKLSDTMTEGKLISWNKSVGAAVERGDIIAEVETDKANMELESFTSGVLLETRAKPGDTVAVGTVIALVGEKGEPPEKEQGEEKPEKKRELAREEEGAGKEVSKEEKAQTEEKPAAAEAEHPREPEAAQPGKESEEKEEEPSPAGGSTAKASPVVRRLAREKGIDLADVEGSGPEGRILREDLEESGSGKRGARGGENRETRGAAQPLTRMRRAIARTVADAWRTIPHFSVTVEVDMGEAERVRQELKGSGTQVSLNDFLIKASANAIVTFPRINASFADDGIAEHPGVNIGIVVALDDGLLVPVVTGCEALSLKDIAVQSRELVKRAQGGAISEREISGGTFTISNMGMFGVDQFMAVIHPPQATILAVGAVMDRPVIREGHLVAARIMKLTLSADHRLIDGAYAAKFLKELKRVLENPVTMLV